MHSLWYPKASIGTGIEKTACRELADNVAAFARTRTTTRSGKRGYGYVFAGGTIVIWHSVVKGNE